MSRRKQSTGHALRAPKIRKPKTQSRFCFLKKQAASTLPAALPLMATHMEAPHHKRYLYNLLSMNHPTVELSRPYKYEFNSAVYITAATNHSS